MNLGDEELERIKQKKLAMMLREVKEKDSRSTMRVVIPVLDETGLDSQLSDHFGRAPYFAVVDINERGEIIRQKTVPNVSEHFGGTGRPPDRILQLKPDAVITYGMGPRGLSIFQNADVAVLRATVNTVREAIAAYNKGKLEELTEGCLHARHQ